MAFQPFHRPPSQLSSVDRKPTLPLDDLESQDGYILDSTMISPTTADRRDSSGNSTAPYFSPQSIWDEDFPNSAVTAPERHFSISTHSFPEQSNNPFRVEAASFGTNASLWPMVDRSSDPRNLVAQNAYQVTTEFDVPPSFAFPDIVSAAPPFGGIHVQSNVQPSAVFPPAAAPTPFETSPTDSKDWMSFADEQVKKRIRNESPPRSFSPFHKRDGNGIRKKTARFDIPGDRTLDNIDQLIANAENEDDVKELKQQKRLLRNRQAALDSRQRKKQHAEDLATQNNALRDQNSQLEQELENFRMHFQNQERDKDHMLTELHRQLEQLRLDKENLVSEHTLVTGDLRRQIGILTERLNEPGNNGSSHLDAGELDDFGSDVGNLTMGEEWVDFAAFADLNVDSEMTPVQNQTTLVVAPRKKETSVDAPSVLLLLLLCGAFVVSRSSPSSPFKMPDEYREASTTVLETVLKDAGVTPSQAIVNNAVLKLEPAPSGTPYAKSGLLSTFSFGAMDCTPNVDSFNQLIEPTKDQEAEQAWSLSAKQYESVTTADFTRPGYSSNDDDSPMTPQSSQSGGNGRNLAERLKAMLAAKGQPAAEVYTRSLLWDRVSPDVVHEFKRMVEESNALAEANAGGG